MSQDSLGPELFWLTLTVLMTALMWVPYIISRLFEQGFARALWDPQGVTGTRVTWADRMMRAHQNAVENLVIFAPLVLMVHMTGMSNELTALMCMVYFYARLLHFLVFSFGTPVLRIPVFAVGVAAQLVLGLRLLGLV
ncbi:MAG: MAPEG family protein [Chromatiales bacterium]|jgi:uncharacterized MAPEG superfamily protein